MTGAPRKRNAWVQAGEYLALAFVLPATTFAGYAVGYLLDRAFGTTFLSFPFLVLGVVAGFIQLVRQAKKDMGSDQ